MSDLIEVTNFTTPRAPWVISRWEMIAAPPVRVWRALTDPVELTQWWCDTAEVDLRQGGRLAFSGRHVFRFPGTPCSSPKSRFENFEILEIETERLLRFRWWMGDIETEVTFKLENQLELTRLQVVQTAGKLLAWDAEAEAPNWWWVALPNLRSFVESGHAGLRVDYEAVEECTTVEFSADFFTFPWVIWQKLVDPGQLKRWWAKDATVALEPGGSFSFARQSAGPRRVLEVEEGERLVHDWVWRDGTSSKVEWAIEEKEMATRVTLTDHGPWNPEMPVCAIAVHWAVRLLYLKQMSERGVTPVEYQEG